MLSLFVRASLLGTCLSSGVVALGQEISRNDPPAVTLSAAATVGTQAEGAATKETAPTPGTVDVVFLDPQEFTRHGEYWAAPYSSRVVIYEDMTIEIESDGKYHLTYNVEIPRTDVGILLQFKFLYDDSSPSESVETRDVAAPGRAPDSAGQGTYESKDSNMPAHTRLPYNKHRQATVTIPFTRIRGSQDAADRPTRVYKVTYSGKSSALKRYYEKTYRTPPTDNQVLVSAHGREPSEIPQPSYTATVIIGALPR